MTKARHKQQELNDGLLLLWREILPALGVFLFGAPAMCTVIDRRERNIAPVR
jgi:hypothetical protein